MYCALEATAGVGKRIQIEPVVLLIDKRSAAVVTALDYVLWLPWQAKTLVSGHHGTSLYSVMDGCWY